jgi:adenine-specific DNA-methyltransferase
MSRNQRLELNWIGKNDRPRLEPRILIEDPSRSYHAPAKRDGDIFDNLLVHGDNLLALKALEQDLNNKIKCVFIDPPYNTGSAFEQYDDGVEHSLWLSLMRDRLELLRRLLTEDGTIWISIDDNEAHYLKVLCDEVFGRSNFVANVIWRSSDASNNDAKTFSVDHNHILVFSKNPGWLSQPLPRTEDSNAHYTNPDNDPRGPWFSGNLSSPKPRPNLRFNIKSPSGNTITPPANGWRWQESTLLEMIANGEIVFSKDERRVIKKTYLANQSGLSPSTMWDNIDETGHNRQAKYELKKLFPELDTADLFATPKPERLIARILNIATKEGDLVLDSFAGSGTTGAVAQKMNRRWIMVELGDHCDTQIIPRLKKVIGGSDLGGITQSVGWSGGGGFRYFRLASSLLTRDKWDNWIIAPQFNPEMLAEAVCKLMGFTYAPSQHGHSTEQDFIFVTTASLTHDALKKLSEEVGPKRTLLVCCKAFNAKEDGFENLTIRKIPQTVLSKCEWGRDDYSLKVANLPQAEADPAPVAPKPKSTASGDLLSLLEDATGASS